MTTPSPPSLGIPEVPAAIIPVPGAIKYVSPQGSDGNDGSEWAFAKQTVYAAAIALPGGSANPPQCGSGIIYFLDGTLANPTPGVGFYIAGQNDPNYSSLPAGWLRAPNGTLSLIGVGTVNYGPNPHLPRAALIGPGTGADKNHPGIWISAWAGPLYARNIATGNYLSRCYVLGEASNNDRSGVGQVSALSFTNCTGSLNGEAGQGPVWDETGASFWIEHEDCGGSGNVLTDGPLVYNAAVFLIDGRGNAGLGHIYFYGTTNTSQGGIILVPGQNGAGPLIVESICQEGAFGGGSPAAPSVWITGDGASGNTMATIISAVIADGGSNPMPSVQNDSGSPAVVCLNSWGNGLNTKGRMVSLGGEYPNNYQNLVVSPLRQRQAGFFGGWGAPNYRLVGQRDDARRAALGSQFKNLVSINPPDWTSWTGVTITPVSAPPFDSKYLAGRTVNLNSFLAGPIFHSGNDVFTVGDWLVIGVWVRGPSGPIQFPLTLSLNTPGFTFEGGGIAIWGGAFIKGDGEWQCLINLGKIVTIGAGACFTEFMGLTDSAHVLDFLVPEFRRIPSGAVSDNEAHEFANALILGSS